ncbi:TPA: hypothetical protein ACGVS7_002358 [Enterococcus faecium]|nr:MULTISPECIES: hypothetical protein [Enterococcus]
MVPPSLVATDAVHKNHVPVLGTANLPWREAGMARYIFSQG